MEDGARYVDGSVVLTDLESLLQDKPKTFALDLGGHTFTGSYEGLLAIKTDSSGSIQKLAAGHLAVLQRDGHPIVELNKPADVVIHRAPDGRFQVVVAGDADISIKN